MTATEDRHAPVKRYLALVLLAAVVLALVFGYGAFLGDRYRHEVRDVAHNVLGLGLAPNQVAASEPGLQMATGPAPHSAVSAVDTVSSLPEPGPEQAARVQLMDDVGSARVASVPVEAASGGTDGPPAASQEHLQAPSSPSATPPPATAALPEAPLDMPVTVQVKVLVDDHFARNHPDWPSRVQRTLALASEAYRKATHIEFELMGVARFAEPLDGLGEPALHSLLSQQHRDGADLLLAMVDRDRAATACSAEPDSDAHHRLRGLVAFGGAGATEPLPQVLRCLGVLLGGRVIEDPTSDAYRLGSWMAGPPGVGRKHLWLDGDNRARIMARKALPFAEEGP